MVGVGCCSFNQYQAQRPREKNHNSQRVTEESEQRQDADIGDLDKL